LRFRNICQVLHTGPLADIYVLMDFLWGENLARILSNASGTLEWRSQVTLSSVFTSPRLGK